MADVAIVWNMDCKAWVQHLENMLRTEQLKLQISTFEDKSVVQAPAAHCKGLIDATVKLIIVSPCFLQYLSDNNLATLRHIITDPTLTVLFMCGSTESDVADLKDRFTTYDQLAKIEYRGPADRSQLLSVAMEMVDRGLADEVDSDKDDYLNPPPPRLVPHQEKQSKPQPPTPLPKPKPKKLPPTPMQTEEIKFDIVPDRISCQGSHKVMLSFKNEVNLASSGIEIWIKGRDGFDIYVVKEFQQRNPYTVVIKAPERKPGAVAIRLTKAGDTVGTKKLTYEDPVDSVESVLQIYLRLMHEILEAGISDPNYMAMLDQKMTAVLSEQFLHLGPPLKIRQERSRQLFGILDYNRPDVSPNEIPTLLHLAAKFGMKDFCNKLVEFSGHCVAASVSNRSNQQPAALAAEHHHGELEDFLDNIRVVNDHFYEVMEHYGYTHMEAESGSRQSFETESDTEPPYMAMQSTDTTEKRTTDYGSDDDDVYEMCHSPAPERRTQLSQSSGPTDYSFDQDLDIGFRKRTNTVSGVNSSIAGRTSFARGSETDSKPNLRVRKHSTGSMPVGVRIQDGQLVYDESFNPRPNPSQRTRKTSVAASWRPHVEAAEMEEESIYEELGNLNQPDPQQSSSQSFVLELQSKLGQVHAERSIDLSQPPRVPGRLRRTPISDDPSTYIIPEEQPAQPDIFSNPDFSPAYPKYMPQSQRDLVDIGEMYKKKEITQDDVSRLFHDWHERYNKQYSSFVDKKKGLKKMREDVQTGQEKLKSNGSSSGRPQAAKKANKIFTFFSKKKDVTEVASIASGQPPLHHSRTFSEPNSEDRLQHPAYHRSQSVDQFPQATGSDGAPEVTLRRRESGRDSGISVHSRHSSVRPISRVDVIAELPHLTQSTPPAVPPRSGSTRRHAPPPLLSPKY